MYCMLQPRPHPLRLSVCASVASYSCHIENISSIALLPYHNMHQQNQIEDQECSTDSSVQFSSVQFSVLTQDLCVSVVQLFAMYNWKQAYTAERRQRIPRSTTGIRILTACFFPRLVLMLQTATHNIHRSTYIL